MSDVLPRTLQEQPPFYNIYKYNWVGLSPGELSTADAVHEKNSNGCIQKTSCYPFQVTIENSRVNGSYVSVKPKN